jgi:hypothetical protein
MFAGGPSSGGHLANVFTGHCREEEEEANAAAGHPSAFQVSVRDTVVRAEEPWIEQSPTSKMKVLWVSRDSAPGPF